MSVLSRPEFHDEAKAFEHVEGILWPQGPVCPKCGSMDRHYALKGVRTKASKKNPHGVERHGLYKCSACRSQFTVRMGSIFEESHLPLTKWLQAIHLMCASKKGISAHQMHRILECTYEAAWFLCHRIRLAMASGDLSPLGGNGKTVEVDETYTGRLAGTQVKRGGGAHKNTVVTLVERGGRARSFHVDTARIGTVMPIVRANIAKESALMTDEAGMYRRVGQEFASHDVVTHSKDEYVRYESEKTVHANTVEGFYSIFKRGMKGVYQHCGEQHLHRYLAEFDFRYSNPTALGVDDGTRAFIALKGAAGKRLSYRGPS
ncbi:MULTISPECIES: IS1595 family transposase [unclassified Mesorhizobium]|uniref:IS1595 family transposase n=1 Tax=unclassified Mesorhizobium TaxID=325217 RepID=UPI000FD78F56|nr:MULTISPECIES: IS1595 family transposase [unclassified Mesorhizobium]AZV18266.1 IS1595 family transposase [Mesorhizobium sp. M7A.F.Ce.TU.012.03.2.1]RWO77594.1 MAG: IS1595 family transposase [Mesorhizobium sp.]